MIIYGARPSPFVRKVVIFAEEKGLDYEVRPAGFGQGGDSFEKASPFGKIPALQDGDFMISDSSAIITYMDVVRPDPSLIPTEAKARARTVWYEEFGDTILQAVGRAMFFNRRVAPMLGLPQDLAAADAAESEQLPALLDYLEGVLPDSGYLVEDRFTLADIAVFCPLVNIAHCSAALGAGRWTKVERWIDGLRTRPSIAAALTAEAAIMERLAAT